MEKVVSKRLLDVLFGIDTVTVKDRDTEQRDLYSFNYKEIFSQHKFVSNRHYYVNLVYEGNNFDLVKGKVTFWPKAELQTDAPSWPKKGRQELKPGKFVKLLSDKFVVYKHPPGQGGEELPMGDKRDRVINRLVDHFVEKIKAFEISIDPIVGKNISEVYDMSIANDCGYLDNSCMQRGGGSACGQFRYFFDLVPGLEIVYGVLGGRLYYRALLWTAMYQNQEVRVLDRIYGKGEVNEALMDWADEKGYAYRKFSDETIYIGGERAESSFYIKLTSEAINYIRDEGAPYLDTFPCLDLTDMTLSDDGRGDYTLQETSGMIFGCDCCDCGNNVYPGDEFVFNGDIYCSYCYDDNIRDCEHCGDTHYREDLNYVESTEAYICDHCLRNDYFICDSCDGIFRDDENKEDHCHSCYEENFVECKKCEEPVHNNDVLHYNDMELCESCHTKAKEEENKCNGCSNCKCGKKLLVKTTSNQFNFKMIEQIAIN